MDLKLSMPHFNILFLSYRFEIWGTGFLNQYELKIWPIECIEPAPTWNLLQRLHLPEPSMMS